MLLFVKGRLLRPPYLPIKWLIIVLKREIPGVICKLLIKKVFDHVNGKFLFELMERMKFGRKWRNWIQTCISTVKFSILKNESASCLF